MLCWLAPEMCRPLKPVRQHGFCRSIPGIKVRVVNVVDLTALMMPDNHPHGMDNMSFNALFSEHAPVMFAFHNNRWLIHSMVHGRSNEGRFHVRGYMDRGTTTTPFDMVVLNEMSRFHLASRHSSIFHGCVSRPQVQSICSTANYSSTTNISVNTWRICQRSGIGIGPPISVSRVRPRPWLRDIRARLYLRIANET